MPSKTVARLPLGAGIPVIEVVMPTFAKPGDCSCSWSVVRPGPGMKCLSRWKYANNLCPRLREHQAAQRAVTLGAL